jgi:hypothetical protein
MSIDQPPASLLIRVQPGAGDPNGRPIVGAADGAEVALPGPPAWPSNSRRVEPQETVASASAPVKTILFIDN